MFFWLASMLLPFPPFPKVLDDSRLRHSGAISTEPLSLADKTASEAKVAAFFEKRQAGGAG